MAEQDTIFSSKVKYMGVFPFEDFYKFCYSWLTEETALVIMENKYVEGISGTAKKIDIKWTGTKKVTDYFKFQFIVDFEIIGLKPVEITKGNEKIKSNKGTIQVKVTGNLIRDYQGKFESNAFQKVLRSIYEKWIIPSRIEDFEEKLYVQCDNFLSQIKAYFDLEGKK